MIQPRPPQPSYLRQATNSRRWVRAVAERQGVSMRAVVTTYRTPRRLTVEVAAILRDYCHRVAVQLVRDGEPPPAGADLLDQTIRRYHGSYSAIKAAHDRRSEAATIATIRAMQNRTKP